MEKRIVKNFLGVGCENAFFGALVYRFWILQDVYRYAGVYPRGVLGVKPLTFSENFFNLTGVFEENLKNTPLKISFHKKNLIYFFFFDNSQR